MLALVRWRKTRHSCGRPGLITADGNQQLYLKLLTNFYSNYLTTALPSCEGKCDSEVEGYVHTLKGVAGNLGMFGIHGRCEDIELAMKNNHRDIIRQLVERLSDDLDLLLEELGSALDISVENSATSTGEGVSPGRIAERERRDSANRRQETERRNLEHTRDIRSQLKTLISESDTEALALSEQCGATDLGLTKLEFVKLKKLLEKYDFDAAKSYFAE